MTKKKECTLEEIAQLEQVKKTIINDYRIMMKKVNLLKLDEKKLTGIFTTSWRKATGIRDSVEKFIVENNLSDYCCDDEEGNDGVVHFCSLGEYKKERSDEYLSEVI